MKSFGDNNPLDMLNSLLSLSSSTPLHLRRICASMPAEWRLDVCGLMTDCHAEAKHTATHQAHRRCARRRREGYPVLGPGPRRLRGAGACDRAQTPRGAVERSGGTEASHSGAPRGLGDRRGEEEGGRRHRPPQAVRRPDARAGGAYADRGCVGRALPVRSCEDASRARR